jgi:TolB protein
MKHLHHTHSRPQPRRDASATLGGALLGAAILALAVVWPVTAQAVVEVDITQGTYRPIPIAVMPFQSADAGSQPIATEISDIVLADLANSGLFKPLDQAAFIEKSAVIDRPPRFADWKVINAEALVLGRIGQTNDGRIRAEFRLWDVVAGRQTSGEQFFLSASNPRRVAHVIADAVYERLTGEKGYFDTRIVFIDESGPKNERSKNLAIMDQDGQNYRPLTRGQNLMLTPRFNPAGQEIAYMAYNKEGQPRVVIRDLESGQERTVGNFPNMSYAPRFSPDGKAMLFSLQEGGNANIFLMDLRSNQMSRLTNTTAIDTGPCFSPDGRKVVFESDRTGTQQLYTMNRDGSGQTRISFGDGSYSTPVWSPRGDMIAYTKITHGKFLIGVMKTDGTGERVLTEGFHNEGPVWSPNGRVIMFFRDLPNKGGPHLYTIDVTGYNEKPVPTPSFASDPAWSPLNN